MSAERVEAILRERLCGFDDDGEKVVRIELLGSVQELAALVAAETDGLAERVAALADEWDSTVYRLPPGYPMTVNEFCRLWFKEPLRALLAQPAPSEGAS